MGAAYILALNVISHSLLLARWEHFIERNYLFLQTVSFDDHTHIQETPMMFSRASSLASLSSCDQHSIHSSVFSEYVQLQVFRY